MASNSTLNQRIGYLTVVILMAAVCCVLAVGRCSGDSAPIPVADTVKILGPEMADSAHAKVKSRRGKASERKEHKSKKDKKSADKRRSSPSGPKRDYLSEPVD